MIQQTPYKKPKPELDSAIETSYKCLKAAFFSTLFLVVWILILFSGLITFDIGGRVDLFIYNLMFLPIILTPILSLAGSIYGVKAFRQEEQLSNKEVWIIIGNLIFLLPFILLFWLLSTTKFG